MTNGEHLKRPSDSQVTNNGIKKQKADGVSAIGGEHTQVDSFNALFSSDSITGINESNIARNNGSNNGSSSNDQIVPSESQMRDMDLETLPVSLLQSASLSNINHTVQSDANKPRPTATKSNDGTIPQAKENSQDILNNQQQAPTQKDSNEKEKLDNTDPSKLNDAIAAAGVDIQQEEELLFQQQMNRRSDVSKDLKQIIKTSQPPAFLNNYHLAAFMNKVAKENGVQQNFLQDGDMLELVSGACETWLSRIATKTIMLSRHRRRGIPNVTGKRGQGHHSSSSSGASIPRSELSKELRNLAIKQKELEEKRVSKRILLGLEKSSSDPTADAEGGDKAGVEETLHRAANATAAMMTMNPGRKKYSWM
ncbi:uncharacterized protein SPAPADRAFT_60348, partial [Spathaspora passalidarum NRRL Y-27907]